ncbi:MAG: VWA domain-containing protein [bacterium]
MVAPELRAAVQAAINQWSDTAPSVSGTCAQAQVSAQSPAAAAAALAGATTPTVWISDSPIWSAKLAAAAPGRVTPGPSVATSPLVVAAAPAQADALNVAARTGWSGVLGGSTPVTVTDPATTASGAMMTLAVKSQAGSAPGSAAALIGLFIRLQAALLPSSAAGFTALSAHPDRAPAFITSEQAVLEANRAHGSVLARAIYPSGPTPVLNYTVARVASPDADDSATAAAGLVEKALAAPTARARFAALGLRGPDARPLSDIAKNSGIKATTVKVASGTVTAADEAAVTRLWRAAAKPSRLLAVIDVSGSMADPANAGGAPKIKVASAAAASAIDVLPASWSVGLWSFSTKKPPATDWTELVSTGSVRTQRSTLEAAARSLPDRVNGDTALYATVTAAFAEASRHYDPKAVNVVALLTDGANVDPRRNLDLPTLLAGLERDYDPNRPVHIVTIGFGRDADTEALKEISAATDGQSYRVENPTDIRGVLLDSILANN